MLIFRSYKSDKGILWKQPHELSLILWNHLMRRNSQVFYFVRYIQNKARSATIGKRGLYWHRFIIICYYRNNKNKHHKIYAKTYCANNCASSAQKLGAQIVRKIAIKLTAKNTVNLRRGRGLSWQKQRQKFTQSERQNLYTVLV